MTALRAILVDTAQPGRDRRYAAFALGDLGDTASVPDLIAVLPDLEVRGLAAEALGAIGDFRAAGPLLLYSKSENPRVRASFGQAIQLLVKRDDGSFRAAVNEFDHMLNEGAARFGGHAEDPIADAEVCYICEQPFTQRLRHSAWCRPCNVYFSDAGRNPVVSTSGSSFGHLTSESVSSSALSMSLGPMHESFGLGIRQQSRAGLAWHLIENYSATSGCAQAVWGWFMKKAGPFMPGMTES